MRPVERGIHGHARGEHCAPALFRRAWRPGSGAYSRFCHVLVLFDGGGEIAFADTSFEIEAPAAALLPPESGATLALSAGASGYLLGVSEELMIDAIGAQAESVALRILAERPAVIGGFGQAPMAELITLARGFIAELGQPERGSWMAITAYMRLALISLGREGRSGRPEQRGQGEVASFLQRFRQLVELHFREHWSMRAYAKALGASYDRLHATCRQALGRTPGQLVHERLVHEACLRLQRSAGTIREISDTLGYGDPTYFSHFFKRQTGYSPAAWRQLTRGRPREELPPLAHGFSDWP